MSDTQKDFENVLKTFRHVESLLADGHHLDAACKALGVPVETIHAWADRFALPENSAEVLSSCRVIDAVFPIFSASTHRAPLDHIGSGVAISIGGHLFVLTAAHVTDAAADGGLLFMPAKEGLQQMAGGLAFTAVPSHISREADIYDMGYFRLSEEWYTKVHPNIKPLSLDDVLLTNEAETGDIFTFAGYPWRKSKTHRGVRATERTTYTGYASAPDTYERLGYDLAANVLVGIRLKRTYSTRHKGYNTAPHPHGISGGAVIAWPQSLADRHVATKLRLAAIGHTYHNRENVMAATRIAPYMKAIVRNCPELAIYFMGQGTSEGFGVYLAKIIKASSPSGVPCAVGIGWYTPETYASCRKAFVDGGELPETFAEWKSLAERAEQQLVDQEVRVVRVEIDLKTLSEWCLRNGFARINKHARSAFGNAKAIESVRGI